MSYAEALQMLRIAFRNLSRADVAERSGLSHNYISRLERGFTPIGPSVIRKLAGCYNVGCVPLTRLLGNLDEYDISKPRDYQEALVKISNFFLENQL